MGKLKIPPAPHIPAPEIVPDIKKIGDVLMLLRQVPDKRFYHTQENTRYIKEHAVSEAMNICIVIKVGYSTYDLTELGKRLQMLDFKYGFDLKEDPDRLLFRVRMLYSLEYTSTPPSQEGIPHASLEE